MHLGAAEAVLMAEWTYTALRDPGSSWTRPKVLGTGNQGTWSQARGNLLLIVLSCTLSANSWEVENNSGYTHAPGDVYFKFSV